MSSFTRPLLTRRRRHAPAGLETIDSDLGNIMCVLLHAALVEGFLHETTYLEIPTMYTLHSLSALHLCNYQGKNYWQTLMLEHISDLWSKSTVQILAV